jgi:predicted MFS family arabinose efflux permease
MISTLATLRYRGAHFGRIDGLIGIGVGLGGFRGAWVGGLLYDWMHGYTAAMIFAQASSVLGAVLLSAEAGAGDQLARGQVNRPLETYYRPGSRVLR